MRRSIWLKRYGVVRLPAAATPWTAELWRAPPPATGPEIEADLRARRLRLLHDLRRSGALAAVGAAVGRPEVACLSADLRWFGGDGRATPWHDDWGDWTDPACRAAAPQRLSLYCLVSPAAEAAATLRVLLGSHRRGDAAPGGTPWTGQAVRNLEFRAGDAMILDARLMRALLPSAESGLLLAARLRAH